MRTPSGVGGQSFAEARQRAALERLKDLAHLPGEKATRKKTDLRIEVIFAMMRDGTWRSGKSARELAEVWNLGLDRVEQLSAAASKMLRRTTTERFEDRQAVLLEIQHTFGRLAFKAEQIGSPNALDVAGRNTERLAKYLGLEPAAKHEITGDRFDTWTDEELKRYVDTGDRPERK